MKAQPHRPSDGPYSRVVRRPPKSRTTEAAVPLVALHAPPSPSTFEKDVARLTGRGTRESFSHSGHSAVQARGDGRGRGHRRVERDHVNYSSCVLLGQTSCGSSGQETPTATLPVGGLISLTCECGLLTKRRQALEARLTLAGQTRYRAERTL